MALLRLLALGALAARGAGLRQPASRCPVEGETASFLQLAAAADGEESARPFGQDKAALSRMLYSFYAIVSCPELITPAQLSRSRCRHCEAASFDFRPGELRIIEAADASAAVGRLRPLRGGPQPREGCVLAFRGTHSFATALADLNIFMRPLPNCTGCAVHGGWLRQWGALRPEVIGALSDLGCQGQALYATGSSSGCAVSDYAAFDLHLALGHPLAASIGYNCPKPGDADFARAFDAAFPNNVWKVQIDFDPVRHLPPEFAGYQAVGWAAQYRHGEGEGEGYRVCGKGDALCEGDRPPRLGDNITEEINAYHCAPPHGDTFVNSAYMTCEAKCDANFLAPEWELAPEPGGATALLQRGRVAASEAQARACALTG